MATILLWMSIPISIAYALTERYNLINTAPRCFESGVCSEYGYPGSLDSVHPNAEERVQHIMHNFARSFAQQFIASPFGRHKYGSVTFHLLLHARE